MTDLLGRAAAWLIEPCEEAGDTAAPPPASAPPRFAPPVARRTVTPEAIHRATNESAADPRLAALRDPLDGAARPGAAPHEPPAAPIVPLHARHARRRPTATDGATEPARAVALGPEADLFALAAALALALRRADRAPAAVVLLCRAAGPAAAPPRLPAPVLAAPALPAARRIAARLTRGGVTAAAHGRLTWVTAADAQAVRRAEAATADVPSVLAVLGPRDPETDALLGGRRPVILAAAPDAPLAVLLAADLGGPVHAWTPPPPGPPRLATLAGVRTPAADALTAIVTGSPAEVRR